MQEVHDANVQWLLTQGDENNPPPQRPYSIPWAAVHSVHLQQNIIKNISRVGRENHVTTALSQI